MAALLTILKSLKKYNNVTGLPIFASRESLYTETGWQTLQNRRYAAKIIIMFKIYNGGAPPYLITKMYPVTTHVIKTIILFLHTDENYVKYLLYLIL